jgi:alpha/beta superfamily hydrolase
MEPVDVTVVKFESADGTTLEGDLLSPTAATGTAVVCHPHPVYGGTRQDAVVAALTRAFVGARRRVLRFDFRGAGGSVGTHDGGNAERDDLIAAIDAVHPVDGPLTIAGYSFGADIALSVEHEAADRWIVVAPPLAQLFDAGLVAAHDPRPVDLLVAANDQFNAPKQLATTIEGWTNTTMHVVDHADHFFASAHLEISDRTTALLAPG